MKILIAVDGSDYTKRMLAYLATHDEWFGAKHSYTVVHYPVNAALAGAVPYTVVLVSLDDLPDVRVIGNLPEATPDLVRIGMPVEAYWDERAADDGTVVHLPQWRPA